MPAADGLQEPAGVSVEQALVNELYEQCAPLKRQERALSRQLSALSTRTAPLTQQMQIILDQLAEYSRRAARASPSTQMVRQIAGQLEVLLQHPELPRGLRAPNQAMLDAFHDDLRRRQGQLPRAPRPAAGHGPVAGEEGGSAGGEGGYRRRHLYFGRPY